MIQSNELRIGNYLKCANSDNVFQVTSEDISIIDSGTSKAKAIPITKEWLFKLGFICVNKNRNVYKIYHNEKNASHSYLSLCPDDKTWIYEPYNQFTRSPLAIEIKHVHQLQNLFFALTQKEL